MNSSRKTRAGITLTEIMLALFIMSAAFIPIMGVMGTGIRGTQKDETILRAVQLAQKSLNHALQLPFGDLIANKGVVSSGTWTWTFGEAGKEFKYATASLELCLGKVVEGPQEYTLELVIEDQPVTFVLDIHNPLERFNASDTPANWGWQNAVTVPRTGEQRDIYHKYTLTVSWHDRVASTSAHTYRLVSYKARMGEI